MVPVHREPAVDVDRLRHSRPHPDRAVVHAADRGGGVEADPLPDAGFPDPGPEEDRGGVDRARREDDRAGLHLHGDLLPVPPVDGL